MSVHQVGLYRNLRAGGHSTVLPKKKNPLKITNERIQCCLFNLGAGATEQPPFFLLAVPRSVCGQMKLTVFIFSACLMLVCLHSSVVFVLVWHTNHRLVYDISNPLNFFPNNWNHTNYTEKQRSELIHHLNTHIQSLQPPHTGWCMILHTLTPPVEKTVHRGEGLQRRGHAAFWRAQWHNREWRRMS